MLNKNNLSLGNIVSFRGSYSKVISINSSNKLPIEIKFNNPLLMDNSIRLINELEIDPILITENLLVKLGFNKEVEEILLEEEYHYCLNNMFFIRVWKGYSNSQDKDWSIHVDNIAHSTIGGGDFQYLHELQNLIKYFCGAELNIDL